MRKVLELTGLVGNVAVAVPAVRDCSRADRKSRGRSIRHRYCDTVPLLRSSAQLTCSLFRLSLGRTIQ